jgi:retron-type reverse transcriptase
MSVTHLLNFKFFSVRRISSKRLNNLDIYKKAYEEIVLKSNYGKKDKDFTNDELKMLDMTSSIKRVKLEELMKSIKKWSYKCQPIKKVYIKKANGKLRPLGIPSINDKIIQTVIKLLIKQESDNTTFSVCIENS